MAWFLFAPVKVPSLLCLIRQKQLPPVSPICLTLHRTDTEHVHVEHSLYCVLDIGEEDSATPAPLLLIKVAHSYFNKEGQYTAFDEREPPTDAALFIIYGGMSGFRSAKCHLLNAVTRSSTLHKPIKPN